jgi:4-hydroxy-2-oxoheptanedioate aldolase
MRENRLRTIWQEGGVAINGWLHIPSSYSAEVMAHRGWDSLVLDMQHGPIDAVNALAMLQAISTTPTVPLVRVPWNEPSIIMRMLDAGCYGVICPMVNTREHAEEFVAACRYPPAGNRSFGPYRATLYGGADYAEHANDIVITMAQIETTEALDNLDEILSVQGLDAVFIGPSDLGQSIGVPPRMDTTEPQTVEAIDLVLERARHHDVVAGIFTVDPEYAAAMIDKGFQFVSCASDARLAASAADAVLGRLRAAGRESAPAGHGY